MEKNNIKDSWLNSPNSSSHGTAPGGHVENVLEHSDVLIRSKLCKVDDMKSGQMREFMVAGKSVILINEGGKYFAVGGKCPHYNGSLIDGVYANGRLRCPLHGACFNVETGDIEDYPGLDCLPKYLVNSDVLAEDKRVKLMESLQPSHPKKPVLIIGGGPSALVCAETIRQEGYRGQIIVLTEENCVAYDRPKLSKALNSQLSAVQLRSPETLAANSIDFRTGIRVKSVDTAAKTVATVTNDILEYSKLVIATGAHPREVNVSGVHLAGVHNLRTIDDHHRICGDVKDRDVVIIGTSFIGIEVGTLICDLARTVTVVGMEKVPFERIVGVEVGAACQKLCEAKGIKFIMETSLAELRGLERVQEVVLNNGLTLPAETVIFGAEIEMDVRGFVKVNETMRTNVADVYAIGDACAFPLPWYTGNDTPVNIQHYQMAEKHGNTAGSAIAGKPRKIRSVPFFWTRFLNRSLRYSGFAMRCDDAIIHGDLDAFDFNMYIFRDNQVVAVASCGEHQQSITFLEIFHLGKVVTKDDVKRNRRDDWSHLLRK